MPFSQNREFKNEPRLVVKSEGVYHWDHKGGKIVDGSSALFNVACGHGRKEIADAVHKQLLTNDYSAPFQMGHPGSFALAKEVAKLTPEGMDHVFFTNSGSESIDTALKMAMAYHGARGDHKRHRFVSPRARLSRRQHRRRFAFRHDPQPRELPRRHALRGADAAHPYSGEQVPARPGRARRRRTGERPRADRHDLWSRHHRRLLRRADRRLDRLPGAAQGLPRAVARNLRQARHPAGVRRSDHRLRPPRPSVRGAGVWRQARHHDAGQGDHQRRPADGRGGRPRRDLRDADWTRRRRG